MIYIFTDENNCDYFYNNIDEYFYSYDPATTTRYWKMCDGGLWNKADSFEFKIMNKRIVETSKLQVDQVDPFKKHTNYKNIMEQIIIEKLL
jgi:hypothetical protein